MEFNFSSIMQYYGFVVALDLLVFSSSDNFANANYEGLELQVTISVLKHPYVAATPSVRGGEKIWSTWQIQLSTSTTQKIWIVRIRLGHWRKKHIFDKTSAKSYSADGIQFQQHNAILRFCCSLGPTCVFIFRQFCKCKLRRTWTSSYDQRVPPKIHSLAPNLDVLIPTLIIELQQGQKAATYPSINKAAHKTTHLANEQEIDQSSYTPR